MRKLLLFYILILTSNRLLAQDKFIYSKERADSFYREILNKYGNADLLFVYNSSPKYTFEYYLDGHEKQDLLESLNTVLHEYLHTLNSSTQEGGYHYIDSSRSLYFPFTEMFPSNELNSFVRKGIQDSVYRYGLYVGSQSKIFGHKSKEFKFNTNKNNQFGSISLGIYGLFEEFGAYYIGVLSDYKIYDYYLDEYGIEDTDAMYDCLSEISSNVLAYYEFSLFMSWYLQYAKLYHKDIYQKIMDNKEFRIAFTLKYNQFKSLIDTSEIRMAYLQSKQERRIQTELDYSLSEEDFKSYLAFYIYDKLDVVVDSFTIQNMEKKTISLLEIKEKEYANLRKEYVKFVKDIKSQVKDERLLFFLNPPKMLLYYKSLLTPDMVRELDSLMLEEN